MDVTLGGGGCSYQLEVGAGEHHAAEERISLSCVGTTYGLAYERWRRRARGYLGMAESRLSSSELDRF